ncbi:MAG TPA: tetratricopeptide repeat protein [Longilinea sp.]|nr:tetratricopeptide repeat protein [Longilinea sp.]
MHKRILSLLLILVCTACSIPAVGQTLQDLGLVEPSATPTFTPEPSPTPTPTPLPEVRISEGDVALMQGFYVDSSSLFTLAQAQTVDAEIQAASLLGLGRVQYDQDDCSGAQTYFNTLFGQYPQASSAGPAHYFSAECLMQTGEYVVAAAQYDLARPFFTGLLEGYLYEKQGDAFTAASDYSNALIAYQSALLYPDSIDTDSVNLKVGDTLVNIGDSEAALQTYYNLYNATTSDYTRATVNYRMAQVYLSMSMPEQAYARLQDSVYNFPRSYDTYLGLVQLVEGGIAVDEYSRGLVDYYAGVYSLAIEAFNRYLAQAPDNNGTVYFYLGVSLREIGQPEEAVNQFNILIQEHPENPLWAMASDEKAWTQWVYMDAFGDAAQTLLDFIALAPADINAADYMFEAGRIYERNGDLNLASATWQRMIDEYPGNESSYRALFLAGIMEYRLANYPAALTIFQRCVALAADGSEVAAGQLWIGKTLAIQGDSAGAQAAWQAAVSADPGDYYSIRAGELLLGQAPGLASELYDLGYDLDQERANADLWMQQTFQIDPSIDLDSTGDLASNSTYLRGVAYWRLGLYQQAGIAFDQVQEAVVGDAVNSYRLTNMMEQMGFYQTAIFAARQVLTIAGMDDITSLSAPDYFNHIRFGAYYRALIAPVSEAMDIHPLVLLSLIRQESLFEPFVGSSAGAVGLMQLMPATAADTVASMGWPADYTEDDLTNAEVSIRLGAYHLSLLESYFSGNFYAALAAYNSGAGNTQAWVDISQNDPDLFLESIRFSETRTYIMQIVEFLEIYRQIYERTY